MDRSSKKRKHISLTVKQKVSLLMKLDKGMSKKTLCEEFGVGLSTIYDLKKQKAELLKAYANCDSPSLMDQRKTLHQSKNLDVDRALLEWIRQRRSESFPLSRSLIMAQAIIFHEEMKITKPCLYTHGWYNKFKKRHGLRFLKVCGDRSSADPEAAENFVSEFQKIVLSENLTPSQIYNADETALFWKYVPRKTIATPDESSPSGFKDSKERLTILACSNASGTHKLKLVVVGKSKNPRVFKGISVFPVHYKSSKKAWITTQLFTEWFENHFVPEARANCTAAGLPSDCKIILLLDNCSAHPPAELLIKDNVQAMYLPPNCTSLIQPMDQGILRSLKCIYKNHFLRCMLNACNNGTDIKTFLKEYTLKDAVWEVAKAWKSLPDDILQNGWHNVWPATILLEKENDEEDFEGFHCSFEKKLVQDLLIYAKEFCGKTRFSLNNDDVVECMDSDKLETVVSKVTDKEIVDMILNPDCDKDDSDAEIDVPEKVSIDKCINLTDELINGLQQKDFITEQQIMQLFAIKDVLTTQKCKRMKQANLIDMFRKQK